MRARCTVLVGVGLVAERDGRGKQDVPSMSSRKKRAQRNPENHVAGALRPAYEETVREPVPDEFLDLLGKLS